jgi:hypothetical protein
MGNIPPGNGGEHPVFEEGVEMLPEGTLPIAPGGLLENLTIYPVGEISIERLVLTLGGKELDLSPVRKMLLVSKDTVINFRLD